MNYQVERGIPIPETTRQKYPFQNMNIKDSFMFTENDKERVLSSASYWSDKLEHKYSTRKTGEKTYRIWRIQ